MSRKVVTHIDTPHRQEARAFRFLIGKWLEQTMECKADANLILQINWESAVSSESSTRRRLNLSKEKLAAHLKAKEDRATCEQMCMILGRIRRILRAGLNRGDSFHPEKSCPSLEKIGKYLGTSAFFYREPSRKVLSFAKEAHAMFCLLFPTHFAAKAFELEEAARIIAWENSKEQQEKVRLANAARHKIYDKLVLGITLNKDELSLVKKALVLN